MSENTEVMEQQVADADIDSAWADDESTVQVPTGEHADQPTAENPAAAPQDPPPAQEQPKADPPELFTLKNRDETRQVTRDELVAMAQKGWDYDTVRQERDQLRQYRQEADPALELVKGYAQRNGMSVGDYLDFCRKQELMRGGLSEQDAVTKLGMEKERAELDARQADIKAKEEQQTSNLRKAQEAAQARQKDIEAFYKIYPGVDPKTIPQEVWAAVKNGDTLTNAYTMHENKRLTAELAAERQNKANQAKSPGSLGGNSGPEMDEIDRIWAEDD